MLERQIDLVFPSIQVVLYCTDLFLLSCSDIVSFILAAAKESNADVMISNLQDSSGFTPLHLASGNGNENAILELLSHGADQSVRDPLGRTSLHICCSFGYRACVALFLGKIPILIHSLVLVRSLQYPVPLDIATLLGN